MKNSVLVAVVLGTLVLVGCGGKKSETKDIIVTTTEAPKPKGPVKMQSYRQTKDLMWLDKSYQVVIDRTPDDSLRMAVDETGQKYVDNHVSLRVIRADGSVFFSRSFTKSTFDAYLDGDYREGGILEGFVFDKVDGARLVFASSVCLPQTDEYIPLVVTVSSQGEVAIRRDSQLDTNGDDDEEI